jgi:hypothetical protein
MLPISASAFNKCYFHPRKHRKIYAELVPITHIFPSFVTFRYSRTLNLFYFHVSSLKVSFHSYNHNVRGLKGLSGQMKQGSRVILIDRF